MGFIVIMICEIFTVGGFPLDGAVRRAFSAVHIAAVVSTTWILLMNGAVGYQLVDDGTPLSLALIFGSAAALFVGTGYIALDTAFSWTDYWNSSLDGENQAYALYTLYQLVPLIFLVVFFILEAVLVLKVLGEIRPMCKWKLPDVLNGQRLTALRFLGRRCSAIRNRPDLPVRDQRTYLYWHRRQDQRWLIRDYVHTLRGCNNMDILVEHNGGRLANACHWRQYIQLARVG